MKILQTMTLLLCILSNSSFASEETANSATLSIAAIQPDRGVSRSKPRLAREETFVGTNTMKRFNSKSLATIQSISLELETLIDKSVALKLKN